MPKTTQNEAETVDAPVQSANVFKRKLWVTGQLERVAKQGQLAVGGGKKVATVTHTDLVAAIKPLLVRAGLDFTLQPVAHSHETMEVIRKGGYTATEHYHEVELRGRLTNVDKPDDYIELTGFGTGLDGGDKGYGKAVTYGKKYSLLVLFLAETGDDPDNGSSPVSMTPQRMSERVQRAIKLKLADQPIPATRTVSLDAWKGIAAAWHDGYRITKPQAVRLFSIATQSGWSKVQVSEALNHHLGILKPSDLAIDTDELKPFSLLCSIFANNDPEPDEPNELK